MMFTELDITKIDLFMWAMIALSFAVGMVIGYLFGFSDGKAQLHDGWIIKQQNCSRWNKPV